MREPTPSPLLIDEPVTTSEPEAIPTSTALPPPTPEPRIINPVAQEIISELNERGYPTRLTGRMFASDNCMYKYESDLHGYNAGPGIEFGFGERFDLYPFDSEILATEAANKIPPDGECRGDRITRDYVNASPYFQCGALIAYVQSPDEQLQEAFLELCGPPFAVTVARFPSLR